jgi:hypothetical protein
MVLSVDPTYGEGMLMFSYEQLRPLHFLRSVHNIRIERLWVDVTQGFGTAWYNFFIELEVHYNLDPNYDEHIWLLHFLFLCSVDSDAHQWAEGWNSHKLRLPDRPRESPRSLFEIDSLVNGRFGPPRGQGEVENEDPGELAVYGVDWEDLGDREVLRHHNNYNQPLEERDQPSALLSSNQPQHLSLVDVPVFQCPFDEDEQATFITELSEHPEFFSEDRNQRLALWIIALDLMLDILQRRSRQ